MDELKNKTNKGAIKMTKEEMLQKIKELLKTIDELANYGFYTNKEAIDFKERALENFKRIWE